MHEPRGIPAGETMLRRLDRRPVADVDGEIRAFMVVRDELHHLPDALAHHRALGVGRFFVVDNGSLDGSLEYLLEQPDVHLFLTLASYQRARNGIDWVEMLLDTYGAGRWCLVLDADERLVYPDADSAPLPALCEELAARGLNCLTTLFIDLYRDTAIATETAVAATDDPWHFDRAGYYNIPATGSCLPRLFGGPRARLFWPDVDLATYQTRAAAFVRAGFDEEGYLRTHADVRDAVAAGSLASGLDHFLRYGHAEGRDVPLRAAPDWPEDAYLRDHPDVGDGVASGIVASGLEHYIRFGQFEGRLLWSTGPPCMTQVPLVRWDPPIRLDIGRHRLLPAHWVRSDVTGGALLHFKLMAGLAHRASTVALERGPAEDGAWHRENERYAATLRERRDLSAMGPESVRFRDVGQLDELALVAPRAAW